MYEIVTSNPLFSGPSGNKLELLRQLLCGWRPDLSNVTTLSRSVIERSWSMNPEERPNFEDIWRELYIGDFDIIPKIKRVEVDSFLLWVENGGGKIDRSGYY
jgi:hypothetical protein